MNKVFILLVKVSCLCSSFTTCLDALAPLRALLERHPQRSAEARPHAQVQVQAGSSRGAQVQVDSRRRVARRCAAL